VTPDEKRRDNLRWNVRVQMNQRDALPTGRSHVSSVKRNEYVVPTDKRRDSLRWGVRAHLYGSNRTEGAGF
jgi:hypothetical protein